MRELVRNEDFVAAAAVRDELSNAQIDDEGHVLRANAELYAAFSSRDAERMKALWLKASFVQCIHPYEKRSLGYTDVCDSWERLFAVGTARKSTITAEDVHVNLRGATAIVVCSEQVVSKALKRALRSMTATNIFRKVGQEWKLVHRHVSSAGDMFTVGAPLLDDEPLAIDSNDANSMAAWRLSQLARAASNIPGTRIIIKQGNSRRGFDHDDDDEDDEDDSDDDDEYAGQVLNGELKNIEVLGDDDEELRMEDDSSSESDDYELMEDNRVMDAARDTVRALRKLSKEGLISAQARIQLMSEMIRTPGESMPERAQELLLTNLSKDEEEAAWEDFAELVALEAKKLETRKVPESKAPKAAPKK